MPRQGRLPLLALAAFALALLALPAAAFAEAGGVLSPELSKLASPGLRGRSLEAQSAAIGVPADGPGSLQRDGTRVLVEIRFDEGAVSALPALREAGARIELTSAAYQQVTASVAPADLAAVARVSGVAAVEAVRAPVVRGAGEAETSIAPQAYCEGGSVLSEGINQLGVVGVNQSGGPVGAREAFGVRGAGVTVGVLSDSFDKATAAHSGGPIATHAAEDIQNYDLPGLENGCSGQQTPVTVLEDASEGTDEGRAMLQIVHDEAPHARLAFATAYGGELNFAHNIERLAAPVASGGAGASVIVDDVGYFEEPMFQDGPVAAAINKVTAAGVTYLTANGNENIYDAKKREIASWETPKFRPDETQFCPIPVGAGARHCLDFDPTAGEDNTFGITIEKGKYIGAVVGWAEPFYGVKADLDLYLLHTVDPEKAKVPGETEVVSADARGNVNGKPAAIVGWANPELPETPNETEVVQLIVNRCYGSVCNSEANPALLPRLKIELIQSESAPKNTETEYPVSAGGDVVGPTVTGHAGAASAFSVGAVPPPGLFTEGKLEAPTLEPYSSHGPATHYFAPAVSSTPAAPLGSPEVVQKPNATATDCGATTFFAEVFDGFWRFCGTSAAAPHAAGLVALMHQANPAKSTGELKTALAATASSMPGYTANQVGTGLVQAVPALEALKPFATVNDPASTLVKPIVPEPPVEPVVPQPPAPTGGSGSTGAVVQHEEIKQVTKTRARPQAIIAKHPGKLVKSRVGKTQVKFVFKSDQKGSSFECAMDKGGWKRCGATYKPRVLLGAHEVKVRAVSGDGETGPAAAFKFTVKLVA